ncbi:hypothetical protein HDE_12541 [Halotydeus destructor]|nr:hypothetical protein HDE_12541 [Halotydeus destructor]
MMSCNMTDCKLSFFVILIWLCVAQGSQNGGQGDQSADMWDKMKYKFDHMFDDGPEYFKPARQMQNGTGRKFTRRPQDPNAPWKFTLAMVVLMVLNLFWCLFTCYRFHYWPKTNSEGRPVVHEATVAPNAIPMHHP